MRKLYTGLFYLALPFILLRLLWRSRRLPGYREHIPERFGFCRYQLLTPSIWIHAVSVGETIAAVPLIKALKIAYPGSPILVTHMTPTGAACLKKILDKGLMQSFIPYDLPGAVNRFLARARPKIAIIMETELWPNLLAACYTHKIPVVIANARLSAKSAQGYHRIADLTREMFSAIHKVMSQAAADAERFKALGLPAEKIIITGNLKFDLELPADLSTKTTLLRSQLGKERPIWIAASTHPTEEEIILAAHQLILKKSPSALLILVPRHPDRFELVAALCAQKNLRAVCRSQQATCTTETTVYLGDTMGELLLMYTVADVAFVAGSFAPIGGHNMLEPALLGKPILTGPILFNFAEISALLLAADGMAIVQNAEELANEIFKLFTHKDRCQQMGNNATTVVARNRGALQNQLECIKKILS